MQIKTILRFHLAQVRIGVIKTESLYATQFNLYGKEYVGSAKKPTNPLCFSACPSGILSSNLGSGSNPSHHVFITALATEAKLWDQHKCPSKEAGQEKCALYVHIRISVSHKNFCLRPRPRPLGMGVRRHMTQTPGVRHVAKADSFFAGTGQTFIALPPSISLALKQPDVVQTLSLWLAPSPDAVSAVSIHAGRFYVVPRKKSHNMTMCSITAWPAWLSSSYKKQSDTACREYNCTQAYYVNQAGRKKINIFYL